MLNELSTPTRMGGLCDSRYNGSGDYGTCGGGGNWNDKGPQYRNGKKLRMKLVAYFGDDPTRTTVTMSEDRGRARKCGTPRSMTSIQTENPHAPLFPGEADGNPKIDSVTLWFNTASIPPRSPSTTSASTARA